MNDDIMVEILSQKRLYAVLNFLSKKDGAYQVEIITYLKEKFNCFQSSALLDHMHTLNLIQEKGGKFFVTPKGDLVYSNLNTIESSLAA